MHGESAPVSARGCLAVTAVAVVLVHLGSPAAPRMSESVLYVQSKQCAELRSGCTKAGAQACCQLLSAPCDECAIQLCDILRGRAVHTFTGHDHAVRRLGFTPDNRILASSSWDTTILL